MCMVGEAVLLATFLIHDLVMIRADFRAWLGGCSLLGACYTCYACKDFWKAKVQDAREMKCSVGELRVLEAGVQAA